MIVELSKKQIDKICDTLMAQGIKNKMDRMEKEKKIRVLNMIAKDMEDDAKNFDRKPFDSRFVAEYLAHLGAAITGLSKIVKSMLEDEL